LDVHDDLLERGFQLASFIVPSRLTAIKILIGAVNKLRAQCLHENKRVYWRDKYLKRRPTRIVRSEADTLQWLIYFESERYEKQQEENDQCTRQDLVIGYIKALVRITVGMSSFYVGIGLRRLLYRYSTSEVQRLYETLTERYLGADEYRRAKAVVMEQIQVRFGSFLQIARGKQGRLGFEADEDQVCWLRLVQECLDRFTPWSTVDSCETKRNSGPSSDLPRSSTAAEIPEKGDPNIAEMLCCHMLIEPACFNRLAADLGFDAASARLAVPRFFMKNDRTDEDPRGRSSQVPPLTEDERQEIGKSLVYEATRRDHASPQLLRVLIDGAERARFVPDREQSIGFPIQEGAKLIEIWTEDNGEELLLATHLVAYTNSQGIAASTAFLTLKPAGGLELAITPVAGEGVARGASMDMLFRPSQPRIRLKESLGAFARWPGLVAVFRLTIAAAIVWGLILSARFFQSIRPRIVDYAFALWISASVGLLLLFLWAAVIHLRRRRAQAVPLGEVVPFLLPVNTKAFAEAMDISQNASLRRSLSRQQYRQLQGNRHRLAREYLRRMSHNAALLQHVGYGQLRSPDPLVAAQAQELIDAGTHVRLYAFCGLGLVFLRRVSGLEWAPWGRFSAVEKLMSSSLLPAYESLCCKARDLTALYDTAFRDALTQAL